MPDPAPLDVREFLTPISEDNPSGEYLRWVDEYAAIEAAREEDEDASSTGQWGRDRKRADWEAVIRIGLEALKQKTKDLQIAVWVTEALTNRRGLPGMRDGLLLVRALQDAFWKTAHPESGDLELRDGLYEFLDIEKRLPLFIRNVPLTGGGGLPAFSALKYKESREVSNILLKNPEKEDQLLGEGRIRAEDFDKASAATDRAFYESIIGQLRESRDAVEQLNASIREPAHRGKNGPTLSNTMVALEEVLKLAGQLLAKKPAPPSPEPEPEASDDAPAEPEEDAPIADGAEPSLSSADPEVARPAPPRARAGSRPSGGPISGPEDARARIAEAARFLREADASDPVPYLVVRALAMGELYRLANPLDSAALRAPTSEDRQALRRQAAAGAWSEVLGSAELALSGSGGTGWLDGRRYALRALAELGHVDAERAARAVLGAELRDYPEWPVSELDDGTPSSNSETRAWIKETFPVDRGQGYQVAPPAFEPPAAEAPASPEENGVRDPWDQVQQLLRDGRSQEAIALVARTAREARTGRERFLRTFQQAEVCLILNRPGVATPLLEGLARQIEDLKLAQWEDSALCARVVAALYRCLRGKDEARARSIYERLCQLDIGQALSLGDGTEA